MKNAICRHIPVRFFLRFLLERPRALSIGVMLTLLPIGTLALIGWLVTSMDGTGPDFDAIMAKGVPVSAEVVAIERVPHITINHKNPVRITYRYGKGGVSVLDLVETMAEAGYHLREGQGVTALLLEGDSVLPDFPPVTFPGWAIFIIDGVFLSMGLPFLLFAFHGAIIKWSLYKRGKRLSGEVDFMASALSIPFTATRIRVAFTCTTEEGGAVKGVSVVVAEGWEGKRRGSSITVLVDISSRSSCLVEEDILKKCREVGR